MLTNDAVADGHTVHGSEELSTDDHSEVHILTCSATKCIRG